MKGVIEYVRDITERKKAEDRLQESLSGKGGPPPGDSPPRQEQHAGHLLAPQPPVPAIKDPDVLEMFKESQRRIRSMALIHERLYQSSDLSRIEFSQYLRNLATHLFHSYQVDASRVHSRSTLRRST